MNKNFVSVINNELYISNSIEHRKLSIKEVSLFLKNDFLEINRNRFIFENIDSVLVRPLIFFSEEANTEIEKLYDNIDIPIELKSELSKAFRNRYFMKLSSVIHRIDFTYNTSFKELNEIVFKTLLDQKNTYKEIVFPMILEKDIPRISNLLESDLCEIINYYDRIPLGKFMTLSIKDKLIIFTENKYTKKERDFKRKTFLKEIQEDLTFKNIINIKDGFKYEN